MTESDHSQLLEPFIQELRRGVVVLAVLSQLETAEYGYSLIQQLGENGFEIDQGTLYPLLRRLEDRGLLESEWVVDDSRPRRYYRISLLGSQLFASLKGEWQSLVKVIEGVLQ